MHIKNSGNPQALTSGYVQLWWICTAVVY